MTITPAPMNRGPRSPLEHCTRGYNTPEGATFPPFLSSKENRCWPNRSEVHHRERRLIRCGQVWSQALPLYQFHVLFNPLFKVLFIFRSLYLCAIGLWPVFSFRRNLPPVLSSIPKLLDSSKGPYRGSGTRYTGLSPSKVPHSSGLSAAVAKGALYRLQLAPGGDFKSELFPLHSPLLGESLLVSFPPLIDMLKFSGYPYLIRGQP